MKRLAKRVSMIGLVVALISLAVFINTDEEHLFGKILALGGGLALIARSLRPPLRFGRGFATWLGGGFVLVAVAGVYFTNRIVQRGALLGNQGIQEAIIMMVAGAVFGLPLLWYGFKMDTLSGSEKAEDAFKRAVKLEARGKLKEAAAAYQDIVKEFADTDVAKDAEVSLASLEKKGTVMDSKADRESA